MIRTEPIPNTDNEGFLPFPKLRTQALGQELVEFCGVIAVPAIRIIDIGNAARHGDPEATVEPNRIQLPTMVNSGMGALRYLEQVGFLTKRPGNPFPSFISVGRAANNDIVMAVETVSKLHAFFTIDDDVWQLTDYNSTNGTQLNGEMIEPGKATPVADMDRLQFGTEITAVWLAPESLYAEARA